MKDVVKLAIDTYKGNLGNFSAASANDVLRSAIFEIAGTDKLDAKALRRNKVAIFEILEETLSVLISEGMENQFGDFAEIRNLELGDTNVFQVPNRDLFKVATISEGNGNLRRQRLDSGEFTVSTMNKGVKIYEEFTRFLAGRIDWNAMIDRVAKSYNQQMAEEVYTALYNSFNQLTATYGVSAAYNEAQLIELAQHVEAAAGGAEVVILGTKMALAKVAPSSISQNMIDAKNKMGFYGEINGYQLREIKQGHKAGTDEFLIDNNFLMVVPALGDKMVKIVNEGTAFIQETEGGKSADMSQEYLFTQKAGIAVVPASRYGIYRLA